MRLVLSSIGYLIAARMERVPKITTSYAHTSQIAEIHTRVNEPELRIIKTPNTPTPEVQLLSNGNYHVMVTNAGGGYSRWRNLSVTRWREDSTCDNWGTFCYLRDLDSGVFWSTAHQPTLNKVDNYEAVFSGVPISGSKNGIEAQLPKLWSHRRMILKCGAYTSPTAAAGARILTLPVMPRW